MCARFPRRTEGADEDAFSREMFGRSTLVARAVVLSLLIQPIPVSAEPSAAAAAATNARAFAERAKRAVEEAKNMAVEAEARAKAAEAALGGGGAPPAPAPTVERAPTVEEVMELTTPAETSAEELAGIFDL